MKDPRSSQSQVTIEDLLRLKRAERPPASFWSDFDREMRAKQLAAIGAEMQARRDLNPGRPGSRCHQRRTDRAAAAAARA